MSGFLSFHRLAAERGDGLHPKLVELLEARALLAAGDPVVVDISSERGDDLLQAGPFPARTLPDFLPGNVIRFDPGARPVRHALEESPKSSLR